MPEKLAVYRVNGLIDAQGNCHGGAGGAKGGGSRRASQTTVPVAAGSLAPGINLPHEAVRESRVNVSWGETGLWSPPTPSKGPFAGCCSHRAVMERCVVGMAAGMRDRHGSVVPSLFVSVVLLFIVVASDHERSSLFVRLEGPRRADSSLASEAHLRTAGPPDCGPEQVLILQSRKQLYSGGSVWSRPRDRGPRLNRGGRTPGSALTADALGEPFFQSRSQELTPAAGTASHIQ